MAVGSLNLGRSRVVADDMDESDSGFRSFIMSKGGVKVSYPEML